MVHEQLEVHSDALRSGIDQDLHDLEAFPDEERFAFLRQMVFRPMATGDFKGDGIHRITAPTLYGAKRRDDYDPSKFPMSATEPTEFLLPEVPAFLNNDTRPFKSVREFPNMHNDYYQTSEHLLMNVPQCYMVRIPKDKQPYLYMSMSECTAIIAHTATDVYAAHVGFGMTSQVEGVMERLLSDGVQPRDIRIVANVIGDMQGFDPKVDLGAYPSPNKRLVTTEAFLKYGIPTENLLPYVNQLRDIPTDMKSEFSDEVLQDMHGKMRPITEVITDSTGIHVGTSGYVAKEKLTEAMLDTTYISSV